MVELAQFLKELLVPALAALAAGIVVALAFVVAQRVALSARRWRLARIRARYTPRAANRDGR